MEALPVTTLVGLGGLGIGIAFGAVTRWSEFCVLGSLADIQVHNDYRRLRAWMLAIAVAVIGTHSLQVVGAIDIGSSIYLSSSIGWLGGVIGGLMFGYGTVMSRGCGGRTLIRVAGGDLRSLTTLIMLGVFAYMTLRGLTGIGREWIEASTNVDVSSWGIGSQGIPELIAVAGDVDATNVRFLCAIFVSVVLLVFCLKDRQFCNSGNFVIGGTSVGVLIAAGWFVTGVLGADDFEPAPLASISFVTPVGDGLQYLMTFSGATVTFGIAVVAGVIAGGFLVAWTQGTFRLIGFSSTEEMSDYVVGGALMGTGGVMALGCTIGQGITGVSTLSLGSIISIAAILLGGWIAAKRMKLDPAKEALGPAPAE